MDTNIINEISETESAENSPAASDTASVPETGSASGPAQTEKTFTQKELDDIVKHRLDRAKKDMPSAEELKEFREWKEGQNSFESRTLDELSAANNAKEAAEKDKQALEIRVSCLSKGVLPEYADDVIALAEKYAGDDISVEAAVDSVIAKYPVFCGRSYIQAASGITTGARTQTGPSDPRGTANFIDVIRANQVRRQY